MTTRRILPALALLALLAVAGCAGGTAGSNAAGSSATDGALREPVPTTPHTGTLNSLASPAKAADLAEPALIEQGHVELASRDVDRARLRAQAVADRYDGQVTASDTESDPHGHASYARMVLRVPVTHFEDAMTALEGLGRLESSSTTTQDVTNQVIDTDARVRTMRASIDRIRALLSAARNIGDIIRIESELSQREADLDSLLQRQAHLKDQTARSTISVEISRTGTTTTRHHHRGGFVGGLGRGWRALTVATGGLLLALGVALPWLPVAAVVAGLLWWPLRRLVRAWPAA